MEKKPALYAANMKFSDLISHSPQFSCKFLGDSFSSVYASIFWFYPPSSEADPPSPCVYSIPLSERFPYQVTYWQLGRKIVFPMVF